MVRILLIVAISVITLSQLTMPILGQMSNEDAILGIAKPLLSPLEEILLNSFFHTAKDGYYAIQGRSFFLDASRDYNNRHYDLALANIDKSIEYFKKFELLNNLIIAEILYQKSLSEVYNLKGSILIDGFGQFNESINYSNEAIKFDPNNKYAWYNKGFALSHLGSYDEAIRCYDSAIGIDPSFTFAINNKNAALRDKGSIEDNGAQNICEYVDTAVGRMLICQGTANKGGSGRGIGIGGSGRIGGIDNIISIPISAK